MNRWRNSPCEQCGVWVYQEDPGDPLRNNDGPDKGKVHKCDILTRPLEI